MQCPNDGATLAMTDRQGVEIDYCPTCRGIWLDRGELDKLLERSRAEVAEPAAPSPSDRPPPPPPRGSEYERYRDERPRDESYRDDRYRDDRHRDDYKKRKKRSFLEDIFDFD